ncbi:MAG: TIGR01620 family protein [Hyphomicrobiales bacterium]
MTDEPRKPQAFKIGPAADAAPAAPKAEEKPEPKRETAKARRPRAMPAPEIVMEPDEPEAPLVPAEPVVSTLSGAMRWGSVLLSSGFSLLVLWFSLSITKFIEDLFAHSPALGWVGLVLAALFVLAVIAIIGREIWGLVRLNALGSIQEDAARAITANDSKAAEAAVRHVQRLYRGRPELGVGLAALERHGRDIMDPADRIRLAERDVVSRLDETANRMITRAARRVTLTTALLPTPALDMLFVAWQNLRMMSELATLYGGRPGTLGTFRLARLVIGHLAVTGGIALTDSLTQHVLGRGVLGRLSSRFGEGAVNGMMTARIGLAALDVCRPLPYLTRQKPGLSDILQKIGDFGPLVATEKEKRGGS